jgi:uncharacterized protein YmfQ (DUF2313 family)
MALGQTADDYKESLKSLAPKGTCWPTSDDSNWIKLLDAVAQEYARVDGRGVDLVTEAFPDSSDELLPNWEKLVGLPDAFSDPDATIEERRQQVLFKLQARGGQSEEYIESLIEALGYPAKIYDSPFCAGISTAGEFCFDDEWVNYFFVLVGGPVYDEASVEGRVRSIQPAHSDSVFYFEDLS